MKFEVNIPSKNRPGYLAIAVSNVFLTSVYPDTGVVIGLDEDDFDSIHIVEQLRLIWPYRSIRLVLGAPNSGLVSVVNRCTETSQAEFILFFGDDCRIGTVGWDAHFDIHFSDSKLMCIGLGLTEDRPPPFELPSNAHRGRPVYTFELFDENSNVNPFLFSFPAFWCCRRSVFDIIGLYESRYKQWYGDLDFSCMLIKHDLDLAFCRHIITYSLSDMKRDEEASNALIKESHKLFSQKWHNILFVTKVRDVVKEAYWGRNLD